MNPDKSPPPDLENGSLEQTVSKNAGQVATARLDPLGNPLVPTATSDPLDPLNWRPAKKYTIIFIVCLYYFLMTYLATSTIPSFPLLQEQFNATYNEVNWTFAIAALGLAVGPLLTAGLADTYGRRICMIVSTAVALVATGCTSIRNQNVGAYMAERFIQGVGAGPAANLGLSIIIDISWEHERGFRVGFWTISANLGTLLGGVFGGFVTSVNQFWIPYHVSIIFVVLLALEIFFLPETLYPRDHIVQAERSGTSSLEHGPRRTRQLPFFNFTKVPCVHHPAPHTPILVFLKLWTYPTIAGAVVAFVFAQYWWVVTLMTMEPAAYADRSVQTQGLLFVGLLIGTLVGEAACSGWVSDKLVSTLAKRNGGQRVPEMRLWLGYPAAALSAIGLGLWGASVEKEWHWMGGQAAFFLFALGWQAGTTVVCTYICDNYPEHVNEISTFFTVVLNIGCFLVPWYIYDWVEHDGYTLTFAVQGVICVALIWPAYATLQRFGPRLRKPAKFGVMDFMK